jgi:hypothetical protein
VTRWQLALIAALGHAPGLRLAGARLNRATRRLNVLAALATLLAMAGAAAMVAPWWAGALAAWAAGHGTWSVVLSGRVLSGSALE